MFYCSLRVLLGFCYMALWKVVEFDIMFSRQKSWRIEIGRYNLYFINVSLL